jgi:hypothetical protein
MPKGNRIPKTGTGHLTAKDQMQVNAFKAIYKTMDGTLEDRFAQAIAATSDDVFERILKADPNIIGKYYEERLDRTGKK